MRLSFEPGPLRLAALAVSVLDDIDVLPADDGVRLADHPATIVTWRDLARACGPFDPQSGDGRYRIATLLRLLARVAGLGPSAGETVRRATVLVALPAGHVDHCGRGWVLEEAPGGALDLGIGVLGLLDDPDAVLPLAPRVAAQAGVDVEDLWPSVLAHARRMSALAVDLHLRPGAGVAPGASATARAGAGAARGTLRPVGGCDVLALLAAGPLRRALAERDGTGLRAVAVPTRTRGWFDLARIDPAFVASAWSLTAAAERGCPTPLLVTSDEIALPRPGGDVRAVLHERA